MGVALEVLVTSEWDPLDVEIESGSSLELGTLIPPKKQGDVCDDIVNIPEPDAVNVAMVADSGVGTVIPLKQQLVSPQP